jgi:hypothetical protein
MINHSKIRSFIKFAGISLFGVYMVYRLKEIIVNGGKLITTDTDIDDDEVPEVPVTETSRNVKYDGE